MPTLLQLAKRKGRKTRPERIPPPQQLPKEDVRLTELKAKAKKGFESEKGRSQPSYYKQVAQRQAEEKKKEEFVIRMKEARLKKIKNR